MENGNKDVKKQVPGKKELKKQLADKMEVALPELRDMLGEKKFAHRLKKAAKLLIEGLHKEDVAEKKNQPATKEQNDKKTTVKKAAAKQPAAKAKSAKKVKSTKGASTGKQ